MRPIRCRTVVVYANAFQVLLEFLDDELPSIICNYFLKISFPDLNLVQKLNGVRSFYYINQSHFRLPGRLVHQDENVTRRRIDGTHDVKTQLRPRSFLHVNRL